MLKKTTLAVIGLSASSFVCAGTMGPVCTPGNVTVPCEANQWDIGIQALYLQAIYGASKEKAAVNQFNQAENDWNWGFRAEGSYHYNTGSDISVNWTHYSSHTDQTGFIGLVPVPPFVSPFAQANQNRLDQINVVAGQHVDVGLVKKMRFYGGMQYAIIQAEATNYYPSAVISALLTSPISLFDNTDFKGFGPVIGIDYSYALTSALSVTANSAASILYGTSRYDAGYVASSVGLVLASRYRTIKKVVPAFEAKLGLNYAYNMPQGTLNFEGGYQVINYFNVLQAQPLQNILNPVVNANYGLYGPYFGFKYLGNV
ncbi:membrane protein [Legionella antarctica]|uniref:Membrane protein n=1 Tax=Legionella antarctica TaxID=2708020 RepID=A0A6F8T8X3_9GAMM|nr:Lpg1974 family pore-forming outer membrane protein [Legionella antarctica]BCA97135.1 membrane protein [Legionella antarctica]